MSTLLRQIMSEARHLTEAERCSLFLVDERNEQLVAKVFDGFASDEDDEVSKCMVPDIAPQELNSAR